MHYLQYLMILSAGSAIVSAGIASGIAGPPIIAKNLAPIDKGLATLLGIKQAKRSVLETDGLEEDGKVEYKDFVRLLKVMKQNPDAKVMALYELAGVPGLRPKVENLIQSYTDSDGQLTMNNVAALIESMRDDNRPRKAVLRTFNSNPVYAFIIEKLLTKFYKSQAPKEFTPQDETDFTPQDQTELTLQDQMVLRSEIEDEQFVLEAREIYDDYLWYETRDVDEALGDGIDDQLVIRANQEFGKDFKDFVTTWMAKNCGQNQVIQQLPSGGIDARCKVGDIGVLVQAAPVKPK